MTQQMTRQDRRAMQREMQKFLEKATKAGEQVEAGLKAAVNSLPWWRRLPIAFRVLIGRWR